MDRSLRNRRFGGRFGVVTALVLAAMVTALPMAALAQEDGASPAGTSAAPDDEIVFRVGTLTNLDSPSVFTAGGCGCYEMLFLTYDMLFNFDPVTLEPGDLGLATDYEVRDGGRTWEITIRDGVRWSDGEPLTAADLAFTYSFIVEQDINLYKAYLGAVRGVEPPTFEAPDDTTLIWRASEPTRAPLTPPWIPILPEHIYGDMTLEEARSFENVPAVGSGPFVLTEWESDQFWTVERNEQYWGTTPTIDRVEFRVYSNEEAMVTALKSGEIDIADGLNPNLWRSLEGDENITIHEGTAGYFTNFAFNFGGQSEKADPNPALEDADVRLAIAHAIDRQVLVDNVLLGTGTVGTSVTLPLSPYHWDPEPGEEIGFDPAEAQRLLDTAGYDDTDGDGIREMPDGEPFELDTFVQSSDPAAVKSLRLIAGWLEDVGVLVNVDVVGGGEAGTRWGNGDFDAYVWGWGPEPDPDFILSVFTTDMCGVWSDGCYSDPAFDRMYEEQRVETDVEARKQMTLDMQRYLYEDNAELVLYYYNQLQAYRNDRFEGYVPAPQPEGFLVMGWGPYSYINLKPVEGASTASTGSSGVSGAVWIAVVAGALVIAGAVLVLRRRGNADDRE
ncbi:MAG: ABC transporter substrate-binding protein [Actinomycetota bacterium]